MQLPVAVAQQVGLQRGGRVTLNDDRTALRMTWPSQQPTLGSVRAIAMDLGAQIGDYLFLRFMPQQRFEALLARRGELTERAGWHALAALCGVDGEGSRDWRQRVGEAIPAGAPGR